jgi:hypothetical protein
MPSKVQAVQDFPVPANAKAVRSFLGLTSYYRRYIKNYGTIASPLYSLCSKSSKPFKWEAKHQTAFDALKHCLAHKITLSFPNYDYPFIIATDASSVGVSGVLSQIIDGCERPVAFTSRVLSKTEKNYSTYERELIGILFSLQQFRPYVWGQKFDLFTDHAPLTWLKTVKHPNSRLVNWLTQLAEYNFTVKYKRGSENTNADALSRAPLTNGSLQTTIAVNAVTAVKETPTRQISALAPAITLTDIRDAQLADPILACLDASVDANEFMDPAARTLRQYLDDIYERDDILYIVDRESSDRILLPPSMHARVLEQFHDAPFAGHLGVTRTYERIQRDYYWPGLRAIVNDYVKSCRDCAMFKPASVNTTPPLMPITSTHPFELIEMDIVGPFPVSDKGNRYILTVIDHFTRWPEAYALSKQDTQSVLDCLEDFISRHGVPDQILTDQGTNFEAQLFKSFCQSLGIN